MDTTTSSDLNGKWIEVKTKTDTLIFKSWESIETMTLNRGKEVRDGQLLPKSGSGPYEYKLATGKISLYWMLSSSYSFNDYNFKRTGDTFVIGNFYNSPSGTTLTFKKIQ
ncbi:MAG: hypothetical protein KDC74_02785 [Flavobacteriaceae bacterium]|nr:hypothetical protein [Flavobacteriaceae bacterium]